MSRKETAEVENDMTEDVPSLGAPIGSLMSRNVVCVRPEMSLVKLRELMIDRGVSGVPVVDDARKVVGFVSVTDLVRGTASIEAALARDVPIDHDLERIEVDPLDTPVHAARALTAADIMWASPLELPERCTVGQAASLMAREHVHRLPVVSSEGRAVGMVTSLDILRWIAQEPRGSGVLPRAAAAGGPFAELIDVSSDILACRVSRDGVITDVTAGLATLLESPEQDLVGETWVSVLDPEDTERITSGPDFEVRLAKRGGGSVCIEWSARTAPDGSRLLLGHDVTRAQLARRRLDAQIMCAEVIGESQSAGEAAARILDVLGRCEGWRSAVLWWKDASANRIRREASWPVPSIERASLVPDEGLAARCWERGEPLWMFAERPSTNGARQATCAVPLRLRSEAVGVLELAGPTGPLDEELTRLLGQLTVSLSRLDHAEGRPMQTAEAIAAVRPPHPEVDRLVLLGSLAGGIAHQINNALTYVRLGLGRLLTFELSRKPHTPSRLHRIELLHDIREGFNLVEGVARQLDRFSKNDTLALQPVDLREVLDSAAQVVQNDIRHRARLVCDYGAVPAVRGNAASLRAVFLNVLVNASQAIEAGRANENEIRIKTTMADEGHVAVEVRDTGIGIAPELVEKIFDPFFTTKPDPKGAGLGLSLSRDIVESLGGTISAESVLGRGTTIRVVLAASDSPVQREPEPERSDATKPRLGRRVLIIDDDRPVANAVALELEEHDVVVAGGGREALEILRRDKSFDVVLCDLMMPDMTGMELYETLAAVEPELAKRFVFMTGGAFTSRSQRFLDEVPNPRIQKPFHTAALQALVRGLAAEPKE